MSVDPQLRERLEQAAGFVNVDMERRLDRTHGVAERRVKGRRTRAIAVAAVIAAVAGVLVWQLRFVDEQGVTPAGTAPTGRIGYLGPAQGDHRGLFDLDLATGNAAALSGASESVLWAEWSPDGSQVAYIVEEPGPLFAIIVADSEGSHPRTIVEEPGTGAVGPDLIDVSWSPDGSKIAYSGRVVEQGVARRTILIVNADGRGKPEALDGLWVSVSWSPDGARLLMSGFPGDRAQFDLYTIRPDGSGLTQLTHDKAVEIDPSWSPEGTRIVFAKGGDYSQDIYVMSADATEVHRLTVWEGLDLLPVWSPDGRWIAFASDRDATPAEQESNQSGQAMFSGLSLFVMHADGSDTSKLLEGDAVLPVTWTT